MLLLATSSLLLFFITYFTGVGTLSMLNKWLGVTLKVDFLGVFFTGLMFSYVYFNIISLFHPVNFLLLIPLLLFSSFIAIKNKHLAGLLYGIYHTVTLFLNNRNYGVSFCFLMVLFLYWIAPPGNWDSGDYHYLSIKWYEEYSVVPGLANVHSRLAFNPATFIISAAYSFSHVFGQALYPLNGVIALLYYTWLLRMVFLQTSVAAKSVLIIYAVLELRDTLINITSPSSDMLVVALISYCGITAYMQVIDGTLNISTLWMLILINAFSACAKLSAIPTLLLMPFLWYYSSERRNLHLLFKTGIALMLLWLPWLTRNVIMSGYLLYPINITRFFSFDWSIPEDVLLLDDYYTKYGIRGVEPSFELTKMNAFQLLAVWVKTSIKHYLFSFTIAIVAFVSPILSIVYLRFKKVKFSKGLPVLFGIYYLSAVIWLLYSPEYRFGQCILHLILLFVFLELSPVRVLPIGLLHFSQMLMIAFMIAHYAIDFIRRPTNKNLDLNKNLLLPAIDYRYLIDSNNKKTFPYILLRNNTPLYLSDSTHRCLNAELPCMSWRYGEIEMRGPTLQQGFRNIKNEVRKSYPFLP